MTQRGHLWAVGYDDAGRAQQVRAEGTRLGEKQRLVLPGRALAVRHRDAIVTLNGEPFVSVPYFRCGTFAGFLAGLALGAPPLTGSAAGALARASGCAAAAAGISEDFIDEVRALMKPGTSALFVLDQAGDMPAILRALRGLGGAVLRTNVDVNHAKLVQSTLAAVGNQEESQP